MIKKRAIMIPWKIFILAISRIQWKKQKNFFEEILEILKIYLYYQNKTPVIRMLDKFSNFLENEISNEILRILFDLFFHKKEIDTAHKN